MELNRIYNEDCLEGMKRIPDASVDVILTDPPYLYLKNQKLDRPFDEEVFFSEVNRVLKKGGFVIMFGRGTSFYRWNTRLADLGFDFKEEIIWNKGYCTSPLMPINRVHETVSIHCNGKGKILKNKVPYLEMKKYDIASICTDIKRLCTAFHNPKSLKAVQDFLRNNIRDTSDSWRSNNLSISSEITKENRCVSVMRGIQDGMNEKSIIRTDLNKITGDGITGASKNKSEKSVTVMQAVAFGMNEKSIIREDRQYSDTFTKYGVTMDKRTIGDKCCDVIQSISVGMNEKDIIKEARDHYTAIHPTQKPVRLLERLLNLVCRDNITVLDPFSGSGSTAVACINTNRNYIGFEIDKEYYDLSIKRINDIKKEPKLAI